MSNELKAQDYFPIFMRKSNFLNDLLSSINISDKSIQEAIKDLSLQFNVKTATWGLDVYEAELGILGVAEKPLNERRQLILSKYRGSGNITASMIRSIIDSYVPNCEVEITLANSVITIRFIDSKGVPSNISDCENAIREVIPCHLGLEFAYLYNTWEQIEQLGKTWEYHESTKKTWEELSAL